MSSFDFARDCKPKGKFSLKGVQVPINGKIREMTATVPPLPAGVDPFDDYAISAYVGSTSECELRAVVTKKDGHHHDRSIPFTVQGGGATILPLLSAPRIGTEPSEQIPEMNESVTAGNGRRRGATVPIA